MSHPIYYEIKKPEDTRLCRECRKPSKVVIGGKPYCKQHAPAGVGFALARNTSGYANVSWHKKSKVWRARFTLKGKNYHVPGSYDNPEDASNACKEMIRSLKST